MKKVFFALAIVAMFSFAACGNSEEPATVDTPATTEVNDQTPAQEPAEATDATEATDAENAENAENADAPAAETK